MSNRDVSAFILCFFGSVFSRKMENFNSLNLKIDRDARENYVSGRRRVQLVNVYLCFTIFYMEFLMLFK